MSEQSYASHRRVVPGFHYLTIGILAVNLLWQAWWTLRAISWERLVATLVAVALLLLVLYTRRFALTVQNRVIRLEERLRLERLLPEETRQRARALHLGQLIALRFASDEELPELVRWVLDENVRDVDAIKQRIRSWRADHLRA
jgi:uncharacterized membrane protein YwzB